jgi:Sec-independent protein secretion pathway component TatC
VFHTLVPHMQRHCICGVVFSFFLFFPVVFNAIRASLTVQRQCDMHLYCCLLHRAGTCFARVTQAYLDSCAYMLVWTDFAASL